MKRIAGIWRASDRAERLLLLLAAGGVVATCAFAAVAFVKRPADISNPDVAFRTGDLASKSKPREDRSVDWPRYGYDLQRTKFLNAQRVRPPFRKLWKYDQDQLIEFAPIIVGERMYMIDNDGIFIALDDDTGKVVWKKDLGNLNASSPAFWRGTLLAVNLEPPQALEAGPARAGRILTPGGRAAHVLRQRVGRLLRARRPDREAGLADEARRICEGGPRLLGRLDLRR
jgi:hypothetical protein